jgi:acyl-CoA synthetase (AMP-forming)/AMP-acid ligase II
MNTTEILYIATAICPEREFILFDNQSCTYAQFNQRVIRLANALKELGLEKGDRVAMLNVNCPQYVETYFAVAKLGAIFVPLNFRAKSEELTHMLGDAGAKVLMTGSRYLGMVRQVLPELPSVKTCVSLEEPCDGLLFYDDLTASAGADDTNVDIGDEDVTVLMYTAGTTGRPKGVPLRHSGFVSYVLENVEPANPDIAERNLLTVPLYHVAGMQAMLAGAYGGRTLVLMRQFEAAEWLRSVQENRVSRAMLVPTMLKWVIDHPDFHAYDLASLKIITYGAASMPLNVIQKAIELMPGVQFINAFGQTETASTISVLGPEDHVIQGSDAEKRKKLQRLAASIGKPLPDVEVKIADEQGNSLPAGQVGEICARGPRMMKGYWGDGPKMSQPVTKDGWLKTGDKGWMDEEGYIYLAGRGDDMIIRGGENISPEEVEDVLHSHPGIEEAAVIGVFDTDWGQEPRAIVVVKKDHTLDDQTVISYCQSRLAGYKRPRSVVFVELLPRNPMGKVLKRELREKYGKS